MNDLKMTIEEFEHAVKTWQHESTQDSNQESDTIKDFVDNEPRDKDIIYGSIWIEHTFSNGSKKFTLTYCEGFNAYAYEPDSFETSLEGLDYPVELKGLMIVDEDGDEDDSCILEIIQDLGLTEIDYSMVTDQLDEQEEIDMNTEIPEGFEECVLENTNAPNVKFIGERIGAAIDDNWQDGCFWLELDLYKTVNGKLIAWKQEKNRMCGHSNQYTVKVCDNEKEVIDFCGYCDTAKELYENAGIDAIEIVE